MSRETKEGAGPRSVDRSLGETLFTTQRYSLLEDSVRTPVKMWDVAAIPLLIVGMYACYADTKT